LISKKLAIEVLNEALATGADYAEIYYEDGVAKGVTLENGKVDNTYSVTTNGVGLRLLKENQCIYGFTTDLSKKGLMKLANTLSKSFHSERVLTVSELKQVRYKNNNPIERTYKEVSRNEMVELLKEGVDEIVNLNDPRIVRHIANFSCDIKDVAVYNSKGKYVTRHQEYGRLAYSVIAADQNGFESSFEGPGCQQDFSYFRNVINVKEVAKNAAEKALMMLTAKECPSGKMPVVVGNGWGGVLFHEACGHALEASSVARGLSCFSNKEGQQIASTLVTAIDDSTLKNEWGSIDVDDEGNLGTRRVLIKDGILQDFMIDDYNGRRMNREGNGSSRRQNYRYCPTSRMSNTYIDNGESTPEEIIAATKLGLYAKAFNGGSVNPATGEFNFGCSEAYIIRDGKICEPVKGASLIGKGEEVLKNIDMVANDLAFGQGMCGAASGSVRTNVGQPTIRISEITVGGRGGELK
jgi:TldD protein